MSEMGDDFAALAEASKLKRGSNRTNSARLLIANGIAFNSLNDGAHLIVTIGASTWDFWPGSGLWRRRNGPPGNHRGVMRLIRDIQHQKGKS